MSFTSFTGILSVVFASALGFATVAQAAPIVIDDGGVGFSRSGDGFYGQSTGWGYNNTYWWSNYVASNPAKANWQFSSLTAGDYDVYVTWSTRFTWDDDAEAAPYTVFNGMITGTSLGTVNVNQSAAPAGVSYDGVNWYKLGTFSITGSQLAVQLRAVSTQGGTIIADGVFIEAAAAAVPEPTTFGLAAMAVGMLVGRRRRRPVCR